MMGEVQVLIALSMAQAWQEAVQERHLYEIGIDAKSQWASELASQEAGTKESQITYNQEIPVPLENKVGKHE